MRSERTRSSARRWAFLAVLGASATGCGMILGLDAFEDAAPGGAGGAGATTGAGATCARGDRDCVGDTPRECAEGVWVEQRPCAGEAPICAGGRCVACVESERGCAGNRPRRCEADAWVSEAPCANPTPGCREGTCVPASCQGADPGAGVTCGPGGDADCCGGAPVPGGTFNRANETGSPATVSDFRLDIYEVTVGRFRAFVETGKGTQADPPPPAGGAHPAIPESGWDPTWNSHLAADKAALKVALRCARSFWTDTAEQNETRPIGCITWYEAFAFCIWDGGRLPTDAEWNYAAAGGDEQRAYPWGAMLDPARASYDCHGDGAPGCDKADVLAVGSTSPGGDARWGNADMAGNIREWALDWYDAGIILPCTDCARVQRGGTDTRVMRGGEAWFTPNFITTTWISSERPDSRYDSFGARCVRAAAAAVRP